MITCREQPYLRLCMRADAVRVQVQASANALANEEDRGKDKKSGGDAGEAGAEEGDVDDGASQASATRKPSMASIAKVQGGVTGIGSLHRDGSVSSLTCAPFLPPCRLPRQLRQGSAGRQLPLGRVATLPGAAP